MAQKKSKNIGFNVKPPKQTCNDAKCPFHGQLKIRGRVFSGVVIKADMHKSCTVEWPRTFFVPKYERYERRRTRVHAHNPPCINAKKGDRVIIAECRPISKTKKFVVIENKGLDIQYKLKEEGLEEAKFKQKEEKETEEPSAKGE